MRINLKDIDIFLEPSSGSSNIKGRISGAESASITISSNDEVKYQGGSYLPVEIVDGSVSISGTLTKAWLNNDFFKVLFPQQSLGSGLTAVLKPSFNLVAVVNNAKRPKRKIQLTGVKFSSVNTGSVGLSGHAVQNLPFNATGYQFLD